MTSDSMNDPPPPPEGVRFDWWAVPERVRSLVDGFLGSPVVEAISQPTGFSPGVAARARCADGRRVFVKAVSAQLNPDTPDMHRREARIVAQLPESAPVPRLLWSHDENADASGSADGDGWVVLLFEDVDGKHPEQPWRADERERVLRELFRLSKSLTPSPLSLKEADSPADVYREDHRGWQLILNGPEELRRQLAGLDTWAASHLSELAQIEATAPSAVEGNTLLQHDVRADNMRLTPEKVWFFDWPSARVGAAWDDFVGFLPSVHMQGGPPPEELIVRHPAYAAADPEAVTAAVTAVAGYFTQRSLLPPPRGIPTVRAFQAAQGVVARDWIRQRTGWK